MTKISQILQVDSFKHKEKLYFLDQLQNPTGLQVINSGTNSNLNFKRYKTFYKNLINYLKFHLDMIYLNMNLDLLTCIRISVVSLQVGTGTSFISYPIRAGHLSILFPLSQVQPL
jgi:hypothetical protein